MKKKLTFIGLILFSVILSGCFKTVSNSRMYYLLDNTFNEEKYYYIGCDSEYHYFLNEKKRQSSKFKIKRNELSLKKENIFALTQDRNLWINLNSFELKNLYTGYIEVEAKIVKIEPGGGIRLVHEDGVDEWFNAISFEILRPSPLKNEILFINYESNDEEFSSFKINDCFKMLIDKESLKHGSINGPGMIKKMKKI